MFSILLTAVSALLVSAEAPHVIAHMEGGVIGEEVAYNDGRPDAPHQAGSIGKYACTLAALRLENEGLLSLDATIAELLPEFEGPHADEITLRRLLENRAGLADQLVPALQSDPDLPDASYTPLEAANRISVGEATKAPGTAFEYVNGNWVVIGAIIEEAADAPLLDAIQDWVLEPAGATSAYMMDGALTGPHPVTATGDSIPLPAFVACIGGLAATPTDLLKISRYPFVSDDFDFDDLTTLRMVTSLEQNYTIGGRYALVSDVDGANMRRISWQSGNNGPWYAFVAYDPETDNGIAMVTPDAENGEILLEKRSDWVKDQGLILVE